MIGLKAVSGNNSPSFRYEFWVGDYIFSHALLSSEHMSPKKRHTCELLQIPRRLIADVYKRQRLHKHVTVICGDALLLQRFLYIVSYNGSESIVSCREWLHFCSTWQSGVCEWVGYKRTKSSRLISHSRRVHTPVTSLQCDYRTARVENFEHLFFPSLGRNNSNLQLSRCV